MESGSFDCELVNGVVWLRIRGSVSAKLGDAIMAEAIKTGIDNGCHRLLYDMREARLGESISNLYDRPEQAQVLGFDRTHRAAMLCSGIDEKVEFLETVARNRGFQFRIFTDEAECLAWLTT